MEKNITSESSASYIEDVKGLDLNIDGSVQKLCEVTNSTSNSTRSIWYIIIIVSTLSFAQFWNTRPKNNPSVVIKNLQDTIFRMQSRLLAGDSLHKLDLIADTSQAKFDLQLNKGYLDLLRRSEYDNIRTIRIPIVGNAFYVDDLGIFAGFAFIVLLLLLKFVLMRKTGNLKIALISITKRYDDNADEKCFTDYLEKSADKEKTLRSINYCRRKYHYNLLSMNESLSDDEEIYVNKSAKKSMRKNVEDKMSISEKIFFIPLGITFLLFANDIINTLLNGLGPYKWNHLFLMAVNVLYLYIIFKITMKCIAQSDTLDELYAGFKNNDYKYIAK